jgi:hypothetical protein
MTLLLVTLMLLKKMGETLRQFIGKVAAHLLILKIPSLRS